MQMWKSSFPELLVCFLVIAKGYAQVFPFGGIIKPISPDGTPCFCPGDQVRYICRNRGTITDWSGSIPNAGINIINAEITNGSIHGVIEDRQIVVRGVSIDYTVPPPIYTSEFIVIASRLINRRYVSCAVDRFTLDEITILVVEPFMPPTNLIASEIRHFNFIVTWTPPIVTNECNSTLASYQISSTDCGTCDITTNTHSAFCTNWNPNGQSCVLRVAAVSNLCRGQLTETYSQDLIINYIELEPVIITIRRTKYSQSNGLLSAIEVSFPSLESVAITSTISSDFTYSVKLNDDLQTPTCNTSVCVIVDTDPPTTDPIQVSVTVSNNLGHMQEVMYPTIVPVDLTTFLNLDVLAFNTFANVTGILTSSFGGSTSLRVDYKLNSGGELLSATSALSGSSGDTLKVALGSLQVAVPYDYSVFVTNRGILVEVSGTFTPMIMCYSLSDPVNGQVNIINSALYAVGSMATYTCNIGFQFSGMGSVVRTCDANGNWMGTPPTCVEIMCNGLSDPVNGQVNTSNSVVYSYATMATYSCNTGYQLDGIGSVVRTCVFQGNWDGASPTCVEIMCNGLSDPLNGLVNTSNSVVYSFGTMATYSCNTGYQLDGIGSVVRTCGSQSDWTGSAPTCVEPFCDSLNDPTNGVVLNMSDGVKLNSIAQYVCDAGFRQVAGNASRVCTNYGSSELPEWTGTEPTCEEITCIGLSDPVNRQVNTSNSSVYSIGTMATFSCITGFQFDGMARGRTCDSHGNWTGTVPTCVEAFCEVLNDPTNGSVLSMSDGVNLNSIAQYVCDTVFKVVTGNASRVCATDGSSEPAEWTGTEPTCDEITCLSLSDAVNGQANTSNSNVYPIGTIATYTCNTGFKFDIMGGVVRTCDSQGYWTGAPPTCIELTCMSLTEPVNGQVTTGSNSNFTIGTIATYSCNSGFQFDSMGTVVRTCDSQGSWTGPPNPPTCIAMEMTLSSEVIAGLAVAAIGAIGCIGAIPILIIVVIVNTIRTYIKQ